MLNTILGLLSHIIPGNIGDLVRAALAAKNDPSNENILAAEQQLATFVKTEVSAEIAADIDAAQPLIESVFAYAKQQNVPNGTLVGSALIDLGVHFRPEISDDLKTRIKADVLELLAVEKVI